MLEKIAASLGLLAIDIPAHEAASIDSTLRFLLQELEKAQRVPSEITGEVLEKLLRRESIGSTAIGQGVALPHTTSPLLGTVQGAFAKSEVAIDWKALDGNPVQYICLILGPDATSANNVTYMRALEHVSRTLRLL